MSRRHITIVGGGLVGPLLAFLLARRGDQVDVYERRPDLRKVKISAGRSINLALADRGIHALATAGLLDRVRPLLIPMRGRLLHPLDGALDFAAYGQRPGEVIYSVSRNLLNQILLAAADESPNVRLHFEHVCEGVDLARKTLTISQVATGERREIDFDKLIGTDGANSVVRDAVVAAAGGTCDFEPLDHNYKELTIPAGAHGLHQLEREALHIWPRHGYMLIALPNLDGSFTVTLFLNKTGHPSFAELTDAAAVDRFFAAQFPDARALIPDLVDEFFRNPTGLLGTVRCSAWGAGDSALLMGDAAHGIVPFHGQGMNAGFEDCREWIEHLERAADDWGPAIAAFCRWRVPQAQAIAEMALENYVTMRDSVLDPHFQLKREVGFELERRYPQQFVPRYSMIMFHHEIPYAEAQRRGAIQERLLDELTQSATDVQAIDWGRAQALIECQLPPMAIEHCPLAAG